MPIFRIKVITFSSLAETTLPRGLDPFVYQAETRVVFRAEEEELARQHRSFRLDTGAHISMAPKEWFKGKESWIGPLSREMNLSTSAGPGTAKGRVAKDVIFRFVGDDRDYTFDLMLVDSLKEFGLFSLRDLHNNFRIQQSIRNIVISPDHSEQPRLLGNFILTPRNGGRLR